VTRCRTAQPGPEDRKRLGLVLMQTILQNMSLPNWPLLGVHCTDQNAELRSHEELDQPLVRSFGSGLGGIVVRGNQQKSSSQVVMSEPDLISTTTRDRRGSEVRDLQLMNQLAENGLAIIMISSELEEVLG